MDTCIQKQDASKLHRMKKAFFAPNFIRTFFKNGLHLNLMPRNKDMSKNVE